MAAVQVEAFDFRRADNGLAVGRDWSKSGPRVDLPLVISCLREDALSGGEKGAEPVLSELTIDGPNVCKSGNSQSVAYAAKDRFSSRVGNARNGS